MNDQPSRPTSPATPNPVTDPTAAPAPAAFAPAAFDPTADRPSAAAAQPAPPVPEPAAAQPPVAQPGAPEWPAEPGPAWGAAPSSGAQPGPPYGAQPGAAYGAQPGPAYGAPPADGHPPFPAPGASPYPPPGSGGTSGFAIASLIFGLLGGILLSVIFGIVALVQIRKRGQTGRGMAIAGLSLSGCWLLLIIGGVTAAILSDSGNDSTSSTVGGTVSVTELKPGDCINGIKTFGSIEEMPVISCGLPHEGEVYAVFDLPAGPWPGDTAVQEQAEKRCKTELKAYAPKPAETVEVLYLHPLQQSWSRDRGVTCVATDERGSSTGSVRD